MYIQEVFVATRSLESNGFYACRTQSCRPLSRGAIFKLKISKRSQSLKLKCTRKWRKTTTARRPLCRLSRMYLQMRQTSSIGLPLTGIQIRKESAGLNPVFLDCCKSEFEKHLYAFIFCICQYYVISLSEPQLHIFKSHGRACSAPHRRIRTVMNILNIAQD